LHSVFSLAVHLLSLVGPHTDPFADDYVNQT